jgi:hypothetical protein
MSLTFGQLEIGDQFVFAYGWPPREREVIDASAPFTKLGKHAYKDKNGATWRTGLGVAVVSKQHPGGKVIP